MFVWLKAIVSAITLFATPALAGAVDEVQAGTRPLTAVGPLDEQMVAGIDRFCLRELVAARERRNEVWHRDYTNPNRYAASVAPFRQRFLEAIGGVDPRLARPRSRRRRGRCPRPAAAAAQRARRSAAARWRAPGPAASPRAARCTRSWRAAARAGAGARTRGTCRDTQQIAIVNGVLT